MFMLCNMGRDTDNPADPAGLSNGKPCCVPGRHCYCVTAFTPPNEYRDGSMLEVDLSEQDHAL
jgi:hypothetical protein